MTCLKLRAHAKLNWTLAVLGVRKDGYHELDMLNSSLALCDDITLRRTHDNAITLICEDAALLADNLAVRAARRFFNESGLNAGISIALTKRIPTGAGLGGGSADAAAMLLGLNLMYDAPLSTAALNALALELGADVPFCMTGGAARARGIGERLDCFTLPLYHLVLVKPAVGLSTPEVFAAYTPVDSEENTLASRAALMGGVPASLKGRLFNALFPPAAQLCPVLAEIQVALGDCGAAAWGMTGSGAACFGVFETRAASLVALKTLWHTRPELWACATHTFSRGVTVVQND